MDEISIKLDFILKKLSIIESKITQSEDKFTVIQDKLTVLENKQIELVTNMHTDILKLDERLDIINESTQNMDDHISFVENVYKVVKNPMTSILTFYYGSDNAFTHQLQNVHAKKLE